MEKLRFIGILAYPKIADLFNGDYSYIISTEDAKFSVKNVMKTIKIYNRDRDNSYMRYILLYFQKSIMTLLSFVRLCIIKYIFT